MEAEGYVLQAYLERGSLGGAEEPSRAEQVGLTDSGIDRDPEDFQRASEEETAAAATAAATEHNAKMLGRRSRLTDTDSCGDPEDCLGCL